MSRFLIIFLSSVLTIYSQTNHSLSFDGVDDYVDIGTQTSYDFGFDDFSLTAFIKPSTNSQNSLNSIIKIF